MPRQTSVRINRKVTFFIEYSRAKKSKYCCHPPFHPNTYFLSPFFKTFVTHPPKINELNTVVTPTAVLRPWHPSKFGTCTAESTNIIHIIFGSFQYHLTACAITAPICNIPWAFAPFFNIFGKCYAVLFKEYILYLYSNCYFANVLQCNIPLFQSCQPLMIKNRVFLSHKGGGGGASVSVLCTTFFPLVPQTAFSSWSKTKFRFCSVFSYKDTKPGD